MQWINVSYHRRWLLDQATRLFDFFEPYSIDPAGGFYCLDDRGHPLVKDALGRSPAREIHVTTRLIHCFAIGQLMGRPGSRQFLDHGMDFLWHGHRDPVNGGYAWSVGKNENGDSRKQAYGHAFVLLAASSAKVAGHPDADRLIDDISEIILRRFWDASAGASAEEFAADWSSISNYRGQNSNMHLTEACMAAFEATGDTSWLNKAESIATLIVAKHALPLGGRIAEHFTESWTVDREYSGGDVFRPYGLTPGHFLEWTRLLLQLWELGGRRLEWLPGAARTLFANAVRDGWNNAKGGFHYTLDWSGRPHLRKRLWWPAAEGIGAAAFLNAIDGSREYENWYRRIWDFAAHQLIDSENGGWRTEVPDPEDKAEAFFTGKPDLYHALQACLIPLLPTAGSITRGLLTARL